jgi:outer membrane lipoprotein-sorting protein
MYEMRTIHILKFTMRGVQILLTLCVLSSMVFAQSNSSIEIQGVVKNELNENLSAVSVINLKTNLAVTTEQSGNFKIMAERGDSLRFSYVGFEDQFVIINNSITLTITMKALNNSLNEVVVVGYGQQRKINMVGAQSTVKVEDLKQPVANLSATLAGRIAGLPK